MTERYACRRLRPTAKGAPGRLFAALLCLLLWSGSGSAHSEPFYENLLREGIAAHARGDFEGAAKRLRVAAFGMLDEPLRLAESLVRLGLAQAALGDRDAFDQTFGRVIELEELFAAYSLAGFDDRVRSEFEQRVLQWISAGELRGSATFGSLIRRQQQLHVESLAPAARRAELERLAAESPGDTAWLSMLSAARVDDGDGREALDGLQRLLEELPDNAAVLCLRGRAYLQTNQCGSALPDVPVCDVRRLPLLELGRYLDCLIAGERWAEAASVVVSLPPEVKSQRAIAKREKRVARAIPPETEIALLPPFRERDSAGAPIPAPGATAGPPRVAPAEPIASAVPEATLAELRGRLEAARSAEELAAVIEAATRLGERFPLAREPFFIAGEAAYRASNWRGAADYLQRAGGPPRDRPELLFYLSVSLFELGNQSEAARVLRLAIPHLQRTDIVERYLKDILGESADAGT